MHEPLSASNYLASTTFGTIDHALKTIEHVRHIHARVRGKDAYGRPYRADDPHLVPATGASTSGSATSVSPGI